MKKFVLFLFLTAFFFAGGIYLGKGLPLAKVSRSVSNGTFQPTLYPLIYRPITVVVIGRNNGAFVEKTLGSLFSQVYENYRLIYIDDASDDGSDELVRDFLYDSPYVAKVTLVRNEETLGFLPNLFRAVESSADDEIIAVVQGEDWLAHEWVLQRINQYYADPDLWLASGQACEYPSFEKGSAAPLQTFYARLLKQVDREESNYMTELLEKAQGHHTSIPEILYVAHRR